MYERPILAMIRENIDSDGRLLYNFTMPKDPETAIRKFRNQAKSFKLSADDYEVIKTIEERWDRDELIASLCEDLIYR